MRPWWFGSIGSLAGGDEDLAGFLSGWRAGLSLRPVETSTSSAGEFPKPLILCSDLLLYRIWCRDANYAGIDSSHRKVNRVLWAAVGQHDSFSIQHPDIIHSVPFPTWPGLTCPSVQWSLPEGLAEKSLELSVPWWVMVVVIKLWADHLCGRLVWATKAEILCISVHSEVCKMRERT